MGILFGYATDLTIEDIAWDFDGLGISQDEAPVFLFEDTGSYAVSFTATSSDGCPISSTLIIEVVDCTNSIAQTIEDNVSVISMNGSTVIQSSFSSPLNCAILGMDGKQVAFAHGQSTIEMQHQGLASGIYILHIWSKQGTFNQKLWITE